GLGTLAYDLHDLLVSEGIPSLLVASGNPRGLPNVSLLEENRYDLVPPVVRKLSARHRLVVGRNELAALSPYLDDLVLITGGTAYLQEWLKAHPRKTALDFLRSRDRPGSLVSPRIAREKLALDRATRILSAPGLNSRILSKAYPAFAHKIFEVPQIFRRLRPKNPWGARTIDLIAVAQWKDRGVDRDVKGYDLLVGILELLRGRNLRVVVVGEVPFHVQGAVHTGWIDHSATLELMGKAKVFVSPSRNECYSQAVSWAAT
ncbi:MAG: hypothetical protein JRH07_06825, partial [Deltaproteobacteria bacterium]|nr:hypothetical protein [Deltaproteobacteria bacterium]